MSIDSNKEMVARLFSALPKLDFQVVDELVSPDLVDHSPVLGQEAFRPDALKQITQAFMTGFPDMTIRLENVLAEGDMVSCVEVASGTHTGDFMGTPATGKQVESRAAHVLHIVGGRIVEHWAVRDLSAFAGMLPQGPPG